jgi:hypothetical protein
MPDYDPTQWEEDHLMVTKQPSMTKSKNEKKKTGIMLN